MGLIAQSGAERHGSEVVLLVGPCLMLEGRGWADRAPGLDTPPEAVCAGQSQVSSRYRAWGAHVQTVAEDDQNVPWALCPAELQGHHGGVNDVAVHGEDAEVLALVDASYDRDGLGTRLGKVRDDQILVAFLYRVPEDGPFRNPAEGVRKTAAGLGVEWAGGLPVDFRCLAVGHAKLAAVQLVPG